MNTPPDDRRKYLSTGRFSDEDIITIRSQARPLAEGGLGTPIAVIARAFRVSSEAIRKIVRRETYSWVGDSVEPPLPVEEQQRRLDVARDQALGITPNLVERFEASQRQYKENVARWRRQGLMDQKSGRLDFTEVQRLIEARKCLGLPMAVNVLEGLTDEQIYSALHSKETDDEHKVD